MEGLTWFEAGGKGSSQALQMPNLRYCLSDDTETGIRARSSRGQAITARLRRVQMKRRAESVWSDWRQGKDKCYLRAWLWKIALKCIPCHGTIPELRTIVLAKISQNSRLLFAARVILSNFQLETHKDCLVVRQGGALICSHTVCPVLGRRRTWRQALVANRIPTRS